MNTICKIFGHKFFRMHELTEKPYTGPKEENGKKPHTSFTVILMCERCFFNYKHITYTFSYGDLE